MNMPGIPWTPQEAASVNDFLNSPVGRKWLGVLISRKPRPDFSNTERAALTGALVAGYESVFAVMDATRTVNTTESPSAKGIDPTRD